MDANCFTTVLYGGILWREQSEVTVVSHESPHMHSYGPKRTELLARLKRIEGQVRGIQKMIEDDRYCVDILNQLAAIKSATHQVSLTLLESHTRGCVADALANDRNGDDKIDELMEVIRQVTKG